MTRKLLGALTLLLAVAWPINMQQYKKQVDPGEVARQNRITQEILARFLQKKLFPHGDLQSSELQDEEDQEQQELEEGRDDEALQSVESERVSSYSSSTAPY